MGGEAPLEREMATHSSILAREIPWTEDLLTYRVKSVRKRKPSIIVQSLGRHFIFIFGRHFKQHRTLTHVTSVMHITW